MKKLFAPYRVWFVLELGFSAGAAGCIASFPGDNTGSDGAASDAGA